MRKLKKKKNYRRITFSDGFITVEWYLNTEMLDLYMWYELSITLNANTYKTVAHCL